METLISTWVKKHSSHGEANLEWESGFEPRRDSKPSSILLLSTHIESFRAEGGARVLVVEDNAVNQRVALRLLSKLGLRADVAANGREALDMLRILPYHLVLMDCQMPEMNGYEATAQIRLREGSGHRVPIIALTAEAVAGCRERCIESGMDDVITKPVTLQDLDRALFHWLQPSRTEGVPV